MSPAGAVRPSRDDFRALARDHTVVPVWREVLADLETPVSAFVKLVGADADGPPGFLLESVEHAERWGRFSFLGRDPAATLVVRGRRVEVEGDLPADVPRDQGALAAIEALLACHRAPTIAELPPFHGGIVGYLGYDVVREIEHLPDIPRDDLGLPDAVLSLTGHVTAFDHYRQRLCLIENVFLADGVRDEASIDAAYDRAAARLDELVDELARPLPYVPSPPPADEEFELPEVRSSMGGGMYRDAVEVAREHILAGDAFQIVLAQRFDVEGELDPFDVYRVLRQVNPSPYMYVVRHAEATLVGSSPEPMVQVLDGRVIIRPIAGTRYRGRSEEHDHRLAAELSENPKERAEHVMLVDLARNDIGRVVEFGSEHVEELMSLERYSHVMHLTSQVAGELAEGRNAVDVLRATFPAGTVSGAPKVRAMEIIDALEPVKRGPYAGVVGYLDFSGNLDTAITIRTMVWRGRRASVSAGAGIVADSDPVDEDLECHNKARALLTAAGAARRLTSLTTGAR
ncbi:MAG: chorismate-binding protein [Acidimicrobiia bacterium]